MLRDHLGVEQLIEVAHSAGARLAISYAAQHPERVAGLLLITPPTGYLVDGSSDVRVLLEDRRGEPAFGAAIVALLAGPQGFTDDSFNAWQQLTARASYAGWDGVDQKRTRAGRWSLAAARAFFKDVWGPTYKSETTYLRVYPAQLRRKVEPDSSRRSSLVVGPWGCAGAAAISGFATAAPCS